MSGPFARIVAQVVIMGAGIVSKAFVSAYQQALHNAKNGQTVAQAAQAVSRRGKMTSEEATQILNLEKNKINMANILQQYDRYYTANDPAKGGSFYLQSKIFRAKEALEFELDQSSKEGKASDGPAPPGETK